MIYSLVTSSKDGDVVIIGAHDLVSHDDIHHALAGMINGRIFAFEPRVCQYKSMIENSEKLGIKNIFPVNEAVTPTGADVIIYDIDEAHRENYPDWANGSASTSVSHMLKAAKIEHIISTSYKSSSPDCWPTRFGIRKIKYLQIDVEGYDYEVLKSINLKKHQPSIIKFEFVHLSPSEKQKTMELLEDYDIFFDGYNAVCINLEDCLSGMPE